MSLLDVIGPVMVGPSSSHTAGACRLALLARRALSGQPLKARFTLHGSFAKTARGHGTDLALVAGTLGAFPDDAMIPRAFEAAAEAGLAYEFHTADLGDVHPNTVRIELQGEDDALTVVGSSLGGGLVKIFEVNGFRIDFSGAQHTLLIQHHDTPGVIATVARVIADDLVNIAALVCARRKRGGEAMMSVEIDRPLSPAAFAYLAQLRYVSWMRQLPEVMRGKEPGVADDTAASAAAEEAGG